ncbi:MAG TPA: CHASE3 domain-containing protein, partial [Sphingomonas sp.]
MDGIESEGRNGARRYALRHALFVAAILVVAVLTIGLIVKIDQSGRHRDHAVQQERHSYDVLLMTSSVSASMASAEAALGRYAIGADRAMGTRYYDDWVLAGAQIDRLARLVGPNPVEAPLIAKLRALYDARGKELDLPAVQASRRQGWPALNSFNAAGHSRLIGEI